MNKSIKIVFLLVMLAIPAAIFIFLKSFGDNRFDVEIFHQNGTAGIGHCNSTTGQFYVADSLLLTGKVTQVVLFDSGTDRTELSNIEARLRDTFSNKLGVNVINNAKGLTNIVSCGFRAQSPDQLVLVDGEHRIRGYYSKDLDEIDRLIVEVKIILENEQRDSNQ